MLAYYMFICLSIPQVSKSARLFVLFVFSPSHLNIYVLVRPNAIIYSLTRYSVVDKRLIVREFPVRQPLASDSATP